MEGAVKMSDKQKAFLRQQKHYKILITTARLLLLAGFIALWEVTARLGIIDAFIFSSPVRIIKTFLTMTKDGSIFYHSAITLSETLLSFSLIVILGIGTAIILWLFRTVSDILEPYLVVLNSLPKSALAPMLIVWLGNNAKAIIVTAISVAIFGTILNIYTSFAETEPDKIKLIQTLGGTRLNTLTKLVLPSSLKTIISNMKVNIGLSLVGVIIGEFLAARAGLGYLIIYGSQVFKMDWVALSIIILCMISIMLFKLIDFIEKLAAH
jgi:NitT/TauT family transport system permease protein